MEDLKHANAMAVAPPGWEAPCFKPKDFHGTGAGGARAAPAPRFQVPAVRRGSKTLDALDVTWMEMAMGSSGAVEIY